jgi:hypothetical protein
MSGKRTFRTKTEYTASVIAELSPTELALLNFTIYHHPDHVEYYQMFTRGRYGDCWEYLMKNRGKIRLENVPPQLMEQAHCAIKNAIAMKNEATAILEAEVGVIKKAWLSLADELNLTPGSIPHTEMEKTFFCGAFTVMHALKSISDENFITVLDGMDEECEAFKAKMLFDPEHN